MQRTLFMLTLATALTGGSQAAEIQGVIADWNCVKSMVRNGHEKTLQHDHGCSLMKDYKRAAYGLITDEKKFYRLDDPANQHVLEVLGNSHDRDNLRVLVRGDLQGNTLKVSNLSIL